ncbi:NADH:flavin oxidoreductase/NADH oxidase [Nocardioides oleivorans]|uniref:NADH:flavin oxidoreductase/NADH oxidase n=1 Tax=Nocardioides oleivorans TaxID=273676 RepID=A0A4V1RKF2_9ACTN|nr:NADH:flavin oxidoreductase/NADH oxidase [Nocardioides oleivorans]RYB92072.1 NADH:flavin oxidoreductase/NADH oxidase [Nocardioides oleivorans]
MTSLLDPLTLRGRTARNRVWLSPMCQYSAFDRDGVPTDWHLVNLGRHAVGGFGLVITEAAAVVPEGRISPQDVGIWNDEQAAAWTRIVDFVHAQGALAGIQLAHAGRKAGTHAPFTAPGSGEDEAPVARGSVPIEDGGWETVAPSALAFDGLATPRSLTTDEVAAIPAAFADAAVRADRAGFDVIDLHGAHGYLLHQFVSPLVNRRTDRYGGSFENRTRLVVETVAAVRAVWPDDKPLFVRLSATDWADGGWDLDQTVLLAAILRDHGADLVDVSSGGAVPQQEITVGPGYQVPFAAAVRQQAGVAVSAVGLVDDPRQAQEILDAGAADAIMLGRAAIREPSWPLRAAHELGLKPSDAPYAPQHTRGAWRDS